MNVTKTQNPCSTDTVGEVDADSLRDNPVGSDNSICESALMELLQMWPEVPDEFTSSGLTDHVRQCPTCISGRIAMDAAIELANFTIPPRTPK